jgi:hypothetical protein
MVVGTGELVPWRQASSARRGCCGTSVLMTRARCASSTACTGATAPCRTTARCTARTCSAVGVVGWHSPTGCQIWFIHGRGHTFIVFLDWLSSSGCALVVTPGCHARVAATPGCSVGYMDYTGCHQRNAFRLSLPGVRFVTWRGPP